MGSVAGYSIAGNETTVIFCSVDCVVKCIVKIIYGINYCIGEKKYISIVRNIYSTMLKSSKCHYK